MPNASNKEQDEMQNGRENKLVRDYCSQWNTFSLFLLSKTSERNPASY